MSGAAVEARGVGKVFTTKSGTVTALESIDLDVSAGEFVSLIGPSGCGKSTLLRLIADLDEPTGGELRVFGKTAGQARADQDYGIAFQQAGLLSWRTVQANIELPLELHGFSKSDRTARSGELLELVGLQDFARSYSDQLSGGMQQRVAIARMIAPKPGILLFDEPLSNLDAKLRVEMRTELLRVHRATGATSVYVTHDQVEAMTMATHVAVMNEGRIEQFGTPAELVENPASAFVATFVGTPPANLVPVSMLPPALRIGADPDRSWMVRPQDLEVVEEGGASTLSLDFAEASPVAGRVMITGIMPGLRLTAVVERAPALTVGDTVHFRLPDRPSAVFGANGARLS